MRTRHRWRSPGRALLSAALAAFAALGCATGAAAAADGSILIGDLNCTACHAPPAAEARVPANEAPRLEAVGRRVRTDHLAAYLADPAAAKPGARMPDVLHALDAKRKAETIDVLVQYLASLGGPPTSRAVGVSPQMARNGERLYHTLGCVACHDAYAPPAPLPGGGADAEFDAPRKKPRPPSIPKFVQPSVPLGDLGAKYGLEELAVFLIDPFKSRPSGRMPSFRLARPDAVQLAAYLLRDAAAKDRQAPAEGLLYAYYEGSSRDLTSLEKLAPKAEGLTYAIDLSMAQPGTSIAVRFHGQFEAAADGVHTFRVRGGEFAQLKIDGLAVAMAVPKGARDNAQLGEVRLTPGLHAIEVITRQKAEGRQFDFAWRTPGAADFSRIPAARVFHPGQALPPRPVLSGDPQKVARGKEAFAANGCANCHDAGGGKTPPRGQPLASLDPSKPGNCIDPSDRPNRPRYALTDVQRADVKAALATLKLPPAAKDAKAAVARTMTAMNCYACHARDGAGGPEPGRAEYFTTLVTADVGDEGRLPPHLNEAGAKLTQPALERVLFDGKSARPYMAARMPSFGRDNVAPLPPLLAEADVAKVPPAAALPTMTPELIDDGRKLVGTQGFGCVNCHGWGDYKSVGAPSINLLESAERLRPAYVHAYLPDPAKWRPGTRMPVCWPDGVSPFPTIQGGDMHRQIDAIWVYLSLGLRGGGPAGLADPRKDLLVPTDEPIVFRTFIRDVGAHAIAVGFRQRTHIVFDAQRIRLAYAWTGDFLRTRGAWDGRGGDYTDLPSQDVVALPPGSPFALLDSENAAWPLLDPKAKQEARVPEGWKFRGYRYAADRTPTFLYAFNDLNIEETPSAAYAQKGGHVSRRLHVSAPGAVGNVWFRAATGAKITRESDGSYLVDAKVRYRLTAGANPLIRSTGSGAQELVVPVQLKPAANSAHAADLAVEMTW